MVADALVAPLVTYQELFTFHVISERTVSSRAIR